MLFKELSLSESASVMSTWMNEDPKRRELPQIGANYLRIRTDLQQFYYGKVECNDEYGDYKKDVVFGIFLYEYLKDKISSGFNMRVAENDGFWRYMSLMVVPDLVSSRWENIGSSNNGLPDHFYRKSVRIWLKSLWWYVHLSWFQSKEGTEGLLSSSNFSTDTILNLVERSGRMGTYISVYRLIMYYYSTIPANELSKFANKFSDKSASLFRVVMKLNTAKLMTLNPELCLGGVDGYVRDLFNEAGVPVP